MPQTPACIMLVFLFIEGTLKEAARKRKGFIFCVLYFYGLVC